MNKILVLLLLISIGVFLFLQRKIAQNKVMIIPAYFYPQGENMKYWEDIIKYKKHGNKIIVIINQSSGNFREEDANYKKVVKKLKDANIDIRGYVSTQWGQRDLDLVKEDIASWKKIYNIKSIFLDESASKKENFSYYLDLEKYIEGDVIYNFGIVPHRIYDDLDGIKILFEDSIHNLYLWDKDHSFIKGDSAIIVHSVESGSLWRIWFENNKTSFKYYYFTDGIMDNPYDKLTKYLENPVK